MSAPLSTARPLSNLAHPIQTESQVAQTSAHILRDILHHVRFQGHIDVYRAGDVAQLALAHIQDSLDPLCFLLADRQPIPLRSRDLLDRRLNLGEPQKVYVSILLLVLAVFLEDKGLQRRVV